MRKERQRRPGPRTRQRAARPTRPSDEKKFADARVNEFDRLTQEYTWSPWRDTNARGDVDRHGGADVDEVQLRQWRLKCDMLRIATYYRVTGSATRAQRRIRTARTRTRLRRWADSVIRARRLQATRGEPASAEDDDRLTGRKRSVPPGAYCETRANTRRRTQEEITNDRLLARRRRRGPTAADTEIGKRLRDDMCEIANECRRQRRRFGDG